MFFKTVQNVSNKCCDDGIYSDICCYVINFKKYSQGMSKTPYIKKQMRDRNERIWWFTITQALKYKIKIKGVHGICAKTIQNENTSLYKYIRLEI
jgi:hypothetical protein